MTNTDPPEYWRLVHQGNTQWTALRHVDGAPQAASLLHDDHGPCAPLSAEEVEKLRHQAFFEAKHPLYIIGTEHVAQIDVADNVMFVDGGPRLADLRDEKIEALTTLVTEMGAIIAEQRVDIDGIRRDIVAIANTVTGALNCITALSDRIEALKQRPNESQLTLSDDDPTVRAMSSLRAKGLA